MCSNFNFGGYITFTIWELRSSSISEYKYKNIHNIFIDVYTHHSNLILLMHYVVMQFLTWI